MSANKLREQLKKDLERYKNFGTPFTEDMVSQILEAVKSSLPEESHICVTHKHLPCGGCTLSEVKKLLEGENV